MPALNIIAIHDTVRNSGFSSSRPSGMAPNRLTANQSTNTTNALAASTNSQPVLVITQFSAALAALPNDAVLASPQATKASETAALAPKTTRSTPRRPPCGWSLAW
jgi:hypothetical protein